MDEPYDTFRVEIDAMDEKQGFSKVLRGADIIERHHGDPNLLPAVLVKITQSVRMAKLFNPFSGKPAYQCQVFAKDVDSILPAQWWPLGMPRLFSDDSVKHIDGDLAELLRISPRLVLVAAEVPLFCTKCNMKFAHNDAFVEYGQVVVCPHCGASRTGEENITLYNGANDGH